MSALPRITIVTPSYNQGEYLEETILSVLEQNYPDVEYMILDGGSTDNSVEIIKKYAKHLTYWVSEKDKGQTDAIIRGFNRSTGTVLTWMNSDDYFAPGVFNEVGEVFSRSDSPLALCGHTRIFGGKKEIDHQPAYAKNESLISVIGRDSFNQPGTFFHKDAVDKMGMPDLRLNYVMDKEWFVRFLLIFGTDRIEVSSTTFANHRYHDLSKTIGQNDRFITEYATLLYRIAESVNSKKVMELIADKYDVNLSSYRFEYKMPKLTQAITEQLAVMLLLNRFTSVSTQADFNFLKKLQKSIHWNELDLDKRALRRLEEVKSVFNAPNWLIYRAIIKIRFLTARKKSV